MVQCLEGGVWDEPTTWPPCVETVYCGEPPDKHETGNIEWSGEDSYMKDANYDCGLFGKIMDENGTSFESYTSECQWDKTWTEPDHSLCKGTEDGVKFGVR